MYSLHSLLGDYKSGHELKKNYTPKYTYIQKVSVSAHFCSMLTLRAHY